MAEVVFTVGIAASTKSTWASKFKEQNYLVLDSDLIRKECWGSETDQREPHVVFEVMYKRACEALSRGQSVIYCATNLASRHRINTLKQLKYRFPDITYRCVVFNVPMNICKELNMNRERKVPDWLFERQIRTFQMPVENEGWDEIEIITPISYDIKAFSERIWRDVKCFGSQENPHHTLSLWDHMLKTIDMTNVSNLSEENIFTVLCAAAVHDIGKVYTRTYDDKGIAHYYSHNNYGAYLSMNLLMPLRVVQLVAYHMCPYDSSAISTWKKRLGEELWDLVIRLHEGDENAK